MKPTTMLFALAAALTGCTSQIDEPQLDQSTDPDVVTVNFALPKTALSRADKTSFSNGDYITIYRQDVTSTNKYTLKYSSGSFDYLTSNKITKSPGETVRYVGVYPYNSSNVSVVNSHSFRFSGGTTDLLLAVEESSSSNVELIFSHILSKIEFQVKNSPYTVSSVKLLNIEPRYYVDIEGDTYAEGTKADATMQWDSSIQRYVYYIAPMNFMSTSTSILRITYTNGNTLSLTPPSTGYFDNGKCYSWVYDYSGSRAKDGATVDQITFESIEEL